MTDEKAQLNEEQKAAVAKSMSRAGIPLRYHGDKSLKDFGMTGDQVLSILDSNDFYANVNTGTGFSITGLKPDKSYDLAMLTARAMRIMQIDIRVVNLLGISEYLEAGADSDDVRFQNFDAAKGLMITRFYEDLDQLPLSRNMFYKMEHFLQSKIEDGFSVSIQYSGKLDKNKWWSDYLVTILKNSNREIFVK